MHYNLGKTLQDVSNISELPAMAEDAEKLLSNDELLLQVGLFWAFGVLLETQSLLSSFTRPMAAAAAAAAAVRKRQQLACCVQQSEQLSLWSVQAYETLSLLEGTSSCTEAAISSGTRLRSEDLKDLSYYFNKVGSRLQPRLPYSHRVPCTTAQLHRANLQHLAVRLSQVALSAGRPWLPAGPVVASDLSGAALPAPQRACAVLRLDLSLAPARRCARRCRSSRSGCGTSCATLRAWRAPTPHSWCSPCA